MGSAGEGFFHRCPLLVRADSHLTGKECTGDEELQIYGVVASDVDPSDLREVDREKWVEAHSMCRTALAILATSCSNLDKEKQALQMLEAGAWLYLQHYQLRVFSVLQRISESSKTL